MFFRKKTPTPAQLDLGGIAAQLGTELYRGVGKPDGSSSLSATIEFDEKRRIANIKDPLVDGMPTVPPFATVESMNRIAEPLKNLPADQLLRSVTVQVEGGRLNVQLQYLTPEQ